MKKTVLLALLVAVLVGCGKFGPASPRNVILVSIDTLRADHLGCYGHDGIRTPNIDRFALRSLRFDRCFSAVPITLPSHTTMMTGMYPLRHSVRDNGTFNVPDDIPTVATTLGARGWRTAGVIGSFPLTSRFGLSRGFDIWDEDLSNQYVKVISLFFDERKADRVTRRAISVLDEIQDEPFFLFVHYFDPHHPWDPPLAYARQYRELMYDGEIAFVDSWLGQLLNEVEKRGLLDDTVVIITADHGEGLGDHEEFTHSMLLYNETTRVPLLVYYPGVEPGTVAAPVSLVDIAPTVFELLGVEVDHGMDGHSLLRPRPDGEPIYMESLAGRLQHQWNDTRAAVVGDSKYILGFQPQLFDLAADFGERENLAPGAADQVSVRDQQLRASIESGRGRRSLEESFTVADAEVAAQLRALGYLAAEAVDRDWSELAELIDGRDPRFMVGSIEVLSRARGLLNKGEFLLAGEVLEQALAVNPNDAELLKLLMLRHLLTRNYEAAADAASRYEAVGSITETHFLLAAEAKRGVGDWQGALDNVERYGLTAKNRDYYLNKAGILVEMGRPDLALVALEERFDSEPCDRESLTAVSKIHLDAGDREAAAVVWQRMLTCDSSDPMALYNLANQSLEAGDVVSARDGYRRAVEADPHYLPARYGLALVLFQDGDLEGAAEELRRVLGATTVESNMGRRAAELLTELEGRLED